MEAARNPFHIDLKLGSIWVRFAGREFFAQSAYRQCKIVTDYGRGAQPLDSIPAFANRFGSLVDRVRNRLTGLAPSAWARAGKGLLAPPKLF